jgi:hypothetical protein
MSRRTDAQARVASRGHEVRRRHSLAAWVALTAPGLLLPRALVTLGLCVSVWLAPRLYVAAALPAAAVGVFAVQCLTTVEVMRLPGRWRATRWWLAGLGVDALLAGVLLGSDLQLRAPGVIAGVVVLIVAFSAAGWWGEAAGALLVCAGVLLAVGFEMPPLLAAPPPGFATTLSVETMFGGQEAVPGALGLSFATRLSVERSFGGKAALGGGGVSFPSTLSVDTFFAGVPAVTADLGAFAAGLALALGALCGGLWVNLVRVRYTRAAVVARMVAAGRSAT